MSIIYLGNSDIMLSKVPFYNKQFFIEKIGMCVCTLEYHRGQLVVLVLIFKTEILFETGSPFMFTVVCTRLAGYSSHILDYRCGMLLHAAFYVDFEDLSSGCQAFSNYFAYGAILPTLVCVCNKIA